jgi:hypothetical protein
VVGTVAPGVRRREEGAPILHGRPGVRVSQALSRPLPVIVEVFGLRRNIVVLSLASFGVGLGEELWAHFLPTYPEALGAGVLVIGRRSGIMSAG